MSRGGCEPATPAMQQLGFADFAIPRRKSTSSENKRTPALLGKLAMHMSRDEFLYVFIGEGILGSVDFVYLSISLAKGVSLGCAIVDCVHVAVARALPAYDVS